MAQMSLNSKREYLKTAITICLKAAKVLNRYQKKLETLSPNYKDAQGLSTEADVRSEEIIIKGLKREFPSHSFLAEEDFYFDKNKDSFDEFKKGYVWIIDPLDGTNNFLNGLPYYAISIALCYNGKPILGLVYNPVYDECFSAIKGQGAYFSHLSVFSRARKLRPIKQRKKLEQCILSSGFAHSERGEFDIHEFANFKNVYKNSRAVRRFGAAALELSYVGAGRLDGFWEKGLFPWDVAAAGLICEEVAVKVTNFNGQAFNPFDRSIIAVNKSIYRQVTKLVEK